MDIYLGESGLGYTWQKPFPETIKCHNCGEKARVMFVAIESADEKEYICNLHENKKGKYWLRDACATAVYLCENCVEPNAVINQA